MIPVGLAANTAAALLQGLRGQQPSQIQGSAGQAASQFEAQLNAIVPGAGGVASGVLSLGQDLLGTLGLAGPANASPPTGSPDAASQAYRAASALP